MIARVIALFVVVLMLTRLWMRHRRDKISLRRMLVWSSPWLGLGIVMLSPRLADEIAGFLGLETATGIDLVAYVAVGVAFYLLFRVFVRLDQVEHHLTVLTRQLAIERAEHESPPNSEEPLA
jgi:hypothetical protein